MENIQKFRKKGKKLGEYMMTKLRLLRDQKKYRSRGVTLKSVSYTHLTLPTT